MIQYGRVIYFLLVSVCGSPEVASQDGSHLDSLENEEADSSNNSDMDHMEVK